MISLSRIRLALGITDASQDALLLELLNGAVAIVGTQLNRYLGQPVEHTEYKRGLGIAELYLDSLPYVGAVPPTVTDFDVVEQKAPGVLVTLLDPSVPDFELRMSPRQAWLVRAGGAVWQRGYEYPVTFEHGWDVDGLPPDIEWLIIELIRRRTAMNESALNRSETHGEYSFTRFGPEDLAAIDGSSAVLVDWRNPVLA